MSLLWPNPLPACPPVLLRPFRASDLALVAELSTDPYVPLIGTVPAVYTEQEGLAFVARQHRRLSDGSGWSFAIAQQSDDRAVGNAGLFPHEGGRATLGYCVAPSERRRGLAAAAVTALSGFAFTLPGTDVLELLIEPWNAASRATAERCGYSLAGELPQHSEIGGRLRDMLLYRRTREDPA